MTNEELWQTVLGEVELSLSKANFITWFKNTAILGIEEESIIISVPNIFAKERLENKFNKILLESARKYQPKINKVNCIIGNMEKREPSRSLDSVVVKSNASASLKQNIFEKRPSGGSTYLETNLNNKYNFENFVVGSNNELAFAACKSVAENPGNSYNPLFLYGGVGLGKTHLLQSTGNHILSKNPDFRIKYVSMERFANELVDAIQNSKAKEFKNKYIALDLLILDDVQFLAKKEKTQEEFFHVFESLYQMKKQLILSSDRAPKSIPTLEDRLRSRFEGGMMADIGKPDLETRIAIIKRKLAEKNFSLDKDIVLYLAENIYHNVREIEGALNKIIVTCQLRNQKLPLDQVIELINDNISTNRQQNLTPQKIIKSVADFFNLKQDEIFGRSRKKKLIKPRQIAIFLMRKELGLSFPEIGTFIGGRDHSTAIYAYEKMQKEILENNLLGDHIKFIKEKFIEY
jgi:chromosomal replication initiator protein